MSNAVVVKEFTEGTQGSPCPERPVSMSRDRVKFLITMIISELDELACTVCLNAEEKDSLMQQAFDSRDKCKDYLTPTNTDAEIVAAQADALVDSWYYSLNISAQHGINLSRVFDLVHTANMAKRDPATGQFIRRESDGKVIKPAGWQPPDVLCEIESHVRDGSWAL